MEWLSRLFEAIIDPGKFSDALTLGAIYALIAVGYTMVYGIIKLINFAHGEVIMFGTYFGLLAVTQWNLPLSLAILLSMFGCGFLGITLDWTAYLPLRRRLPLPDRLSLIGLLVFAGLAIAYFTAGTSTRAGFSHQKAALAVLLGLCGLVMAFLACLSLFNLFGPARQSAETDRLSALITAIGMSLCLQTIAQLLWTADYRSFPSKSLPAFLDRALLTIHGHQYLQGKELLTWVAAVVLMVFLSLLVSYTKLGKAMRACALDKDTAMLMGINVNHVIAFTFFIGSAMAAVAGLLYAIKVGGNISPRMGYYPGVIAFAAAVLGGIGNIKGAMLGGLLIGFVQVYGGSIRSEYDMAFAFGLMVIFILFRPWGILGRPEATRA